nr:caspase family protein [Myxococcota bacterium]
MQRSLLLVAAALIGGAPAAHADSAPSVTTYALVVGSNAGGPGQLELRYAEDDARRVGALLTELGGYTADSVDVVLAPTPARLRERLARLDARVAADVAAGRQARLFFYYSGHARATAIDLGAAALPLAELRQRLLAVPATLTIVVLDACQSGAFSRVKGATPAADFSFNSRQQLAASGIAVLASSSGSELSQESEELRSSYFTHHLLVGMRGAGDVNRDGAVSVDEAYRYAYHQTLLATAATAVGGQHVSLEVDLVGHGEVPLSFPRAATRSITLPAALEGHALVEDRRAKVVVAETHKARGAAVRIAVAPGEYEVLVRHGGRLRRCQVSTARGEASVDLERCTSEAIGVTTAKGAGAGAGRRFARPLRIELTGAVGPERRDGFVETLENFGYEKEWLTASRGVGVAVTRRVLPKLWVGAAASFAQSPRWLRGGEAALGFDWNTTTISAVARGVHGFGETGALSRVGVYAQLA